MVDAVAPRGRRPRASANSCMVLDAMAYTAGGRLTRATSCRSIRRKSGYADMVRLEASLERVPVERKIELGERLLERLRKPSENHQSWWAVGRIGARRPFYGSAHGVVPPRDCGAWLDDDSRARLEEGRAGRIRRRADRAHDRRPLARLAR